MSSSINELRKHATHLKSFFEEDNNNLVIVALHLIVFI